MNYRLLLTCSATILGAAVSAQLQAQETVLEEIVVTAQKRVETAQEIPLAISVVSADTLLSEGIKDIQDIYKAAPSVTANVRGGGQNVTIGIRGMQQLGTSPTSDPLVAVHLDGAYLASTWGLSGMMYDLDRVEVLEGPQGTLYGRNATAGAINLITKRPGKNFEGNASFEIGDYHTFRVQGGVSMPVSDALSFRFAGLKYTRDSLYTVGDQENNQWGTRLSTVWTPTEADELFVSLDYNKFDSASDAGTLIGINRAALPPAPPPPGGTAYAVPNDPYDNKPYWTARGTVYTGNQNDQRQWGVNTQYKHEFGPFSASLIYSHRDIDGINHGATKRTTVFSENLTVNKMKSDSAELRFVSTEKTPLEWVGGLFYFSNSNEGFFAAPIGPYGGRASAAALQALGPTSTVIGGTPFLTPVGLPADACPCGGGLFSPSNGDTDSYAAYGQGTWTPASLENWHFVLGLRYSHDKKTGDLGTPSGAPTVDLDGAGPLPPGYLSRVIAEESWDGVQWKAGVNYDLNTSSRLYASVSTGYKSGGFGYGPTPLIEPEHVLAFEVGSKNRFLNNTLQLNGAMWYYDYKDLEASYAAPITFPVAINGANGAPITSVNSVTNMGKARLGGASVDLEWLFTDADRFGLDGTYVYSKVIDGKAKANGMLLFREGQRLGNTPEFAFTARYGHTFTLGNSATLLPQLKYRWQSERYDASALYNGAPVNKQYGTIPSTGILDATLKYAPAGDAWDVTAYVYNVIDELDINILQYGQPGVNQQSGHQFANLGDPRLFGLIFSTRF